MLRTAPDVAYGEGYGVPVPLAERAAPFDGEHRFCGGFKPLPGPAR